ncbi:hypothetical protein RSOLAG22IIIB_13593 [Rhizoctonia solani]|uniref:Ricin B lectin domain-containing protein n=1 Tax=Rhizoctonia solani TaxID=456999 RepID=A0A0K6FP64_9AGAM|nr:hypothetical protein RSOLAG22IIIB_13593 [Rhizoctonia solani]
MSLKPGIYELQNVENQQWAGVGGVPAMDPPPPVNLKGVPDIMKANFRFVHQVGDYYHILIPGMDKSEIRSQDDTVKVIPFSSRQTWIVKSVEKDSYYIKDPESGGYWTLVESTDPWGTQIRLEPTTRSLSQVWKFSISLGPVVQISDA